MKWVVLLSFLVSVSFGGQVVVNKDSGITSLSSGDIKNIFNLKKTQWDNGKTITVFLLPAVHEDEEKFASKVLGSSAGAVYEKWVAYILNGGANIPPKTVNENKMNKSVANTSGAIGVLPDDASLPGNVVSVHKF